MRRYLVVANQTLAARLLIDHAHRCRTAGPCWFHLVILATPSASLLEHPTTDAVLRARHRLAAALARFNAEGITATGEVGDPNPLKAIATALEHFDFDEVIVSTFPAGKSERDLEELSASLTRATGLRVTHVAAAEERLANVT